MKFAPFSIWNIIAECRNYWIKSQQMKSTFLLFFFSFFEAIDNSLFFVTAHFCKLTNVILNPIISGGFDWQATVMSDQYFLISGNSNLVYTIIRKRQVFHSLANLPVDGGSIGRCLNRKVKKDCAEPVAEETPPETPSMEGSKPALPAEPGTLNATLLETPGEENSKPRSTRSVGRNDQIHKWRQIEFHVA